MLVVCKIVSGFGTRHCAASIDQSVKVSPDEVEMLSLDVDRFDVAVDRSESRDDEVT